MAYPQDQYGLPIPQFPGWMPLDWDNDPIHMGDHSVCLCRSDGSPTGKEPGGPTTEFGVELGLTASEYFPERYRKTTVVYRPYPQVSAASPASEYPGWMEIVNPSTVLMPMDVMAKPDVDSNLSLTHFEKGNFGSSLSTFGWIHCAPDGYGNGTWSLKKARGWSSNKFRVWRRIGSAIVSKRKACRLPPNSEFKKPLPLP